MFLEVEDAWFEGGDGDESSLLIAFDPWKGPRPDECCMFSIGGVLFKLVFRINVKGRPVFEAVPTAPQNPPQPEQVRLSRLLGPCPGVVKVGF